MNTPTLLDYKKRLENIFDNGQLEVNTRTYGDFIPIAEWVQSCHDESFIDYDGYGVFAFKRGDGVWVVCNAWVYPSDIRLLNIAQPPWATHVLWFNR